MSLNLTNGTFDFCGTCVAHCCSRNRPLGEMESPFVLRKEAVALAEWSNESLESFVEEHERKRGVEHLSLKQINGRCYFYRHGQCSVYESRPIDCRLFPFDIIEHQDGSLYWIVYEDLCPTRFDFSPYFAAAKRLLTDSGYSSAELQQFAAHGVEVMSKHRHKILEPVVLPEMSTGR